MWKVPRRTGCPRRATGRSPPSPGRGRSGAAPFATRRRSMRASQTAKKWRWTSPSRAPGRGRRAGRRGNTPLCRGMASDRDPRAQRAQGPEHASGRTRSHSAEEPVAPGGPRVARLAWSRAVTAIRGSGAIPARSSRRTGLPQCSRSKSAGSPRERALSSASGEAHPAERAGAGPARGRGEAERPVAREAVLEEPRPLLLAAAEDARGRREHACPERMEGEERGRRRAAGTRGRPSGGRSSAAARRSGVSRSGRASGSAREAVEETLEGAALGVARRVDDGILLRAGRAARGRCPRRSPRVVMRRSPRRETPLQALARGRGRLPVPASSVTRSLDVALKHGSGGRRRGRPRTRCWRRRRRRRGRPKAPGGDRGFMGRPGPAMTPGRVPASDRLDRRPPARPGRSFRACGRGSPFQPTIGAPGKGAAAAATSIRPASRVPVPCPLNQTLRPPPTRRRPRGSGEARSVGPVRREVVHLVIEALALEATSRPASGTAPRRPRRRRARSRPSPARGTARGIAVQDLQGVESPRDKGAQEVEGEDERLLGQPRLDARVASRSPRWAETQAWERIETSGPQPSARRSCSVQVGGAPQIPKAGFPVRRSA
jgi:hypothetical protein